MNGKSNMKGISFIEIIIAFALTSVLVAAAMPNFNDYSVRARVIEGMTISAAAQQALVDTCRSNENAIISSNEDAGFNFSKRSPESRFVENVVVAGDCASKDLVVMLWMENTGADPEPVFELRAWVPSGILSEGFETPYYWNCRLIRGEFGHVPSNCRKHYRKS
jgi:Tfp pilus assembly protein PilE